MGTKQDLATRQRAWAISSGLAPDGKGYLPTYEANLFAPVSARARQCFESGSGKELVGAADRSPKMSALHSSSALVVNVFDYWIERPDVVLAALGLPLGSVSMEFEGQFPTGLDGNPPNLDVAIRRGDGSLVGIESKFTEWLSPKSVSKEAFKTKYFPTGRHLWSARGCSRCQELAALINARELQYRYLDAPQLLKHALGLSCAGTDFALVYLYFDVPGTESEAHHKEIEDFSKRIAGDFPFHVRRYQDVYQRLASNSATSDAVYIKYLGVRYFPAGANCR